MTLDQALRDKLVLPAVCAPMFLVSGPALVAAACKAGLVGALPRQNARSLEIFEGWMRDICTDLDEFTRQNPGARVGPVAVNLAARFDEDELAAHLDICARYGVDIIISVQGNPRALTERVHDWGGRVFHDVTSFRFAEKAIAAGVDGLICIGAGGGGHSGTTSHLVLIPKIRSIFDGVIVMAGAVTDGAAIRAAEVLGADLSYLGTRFIGTQESLAHADYKALLVSQDSTGLMYTGRIAGVPANWLVESMRSVGLDPDDLPVPTGPGISHEHLPDGVKPWANLWSAGQGIEMIEDIPSVAELVVRLRREYVQACRTPDMAQVARLVEGASHSDF